MADAVERLAALKALAIAFRQDISPEFIVAYNDMGLADVPTEALKLAIGRAVQQCKFMPSVAELRDLCGYGAEKLSDAAQAAWDSLERAAVKIGYYGSPNFRDPLVNAAVRSLGGWMRLMDIRDGEEGAKPADWDTWTRKRFQEAYERFARNGASPDMTAPLIGFSNATNAANGHADFITPPTLVGLPAPERQKRIGSR